MLGQEGRSPQPVQGGGLVTAGLELVVAASLRVPHVGLGAVLFLLLLTLPSLLPPPLPCFALQGLITPLLEAEKCSVFVIVTVFVRVCSHSLVFVSQCWGKRKNRNTSCYQLCSLLVRPGSSLGAQSGSHQCLLGEVPSGLASGLAGVFERGGSGEGCGSKRDVHTGEDGALSAASAVGAGCNPFSGGRERCVEWMGLCGNRV